MKREPGSLGQSPQELLVPWPRAGEEGDLSPRVCSQGTKSTEAQITEKHLEQAWGGRTTHTGPTTSGPSCCAGRVILAHR